MRRDSISFLVAFGAVALAFVVSTMVAQRAAREVGGLAAFIARDAAPGLASMAGVRGEVRRMQAIVSREATLGPAPGDQTAIDDTRKSLDARLAEFGALPTSPEELALLNDLQADIRAFDESVERVIAQLGSGHRGEADATLVHDLRQRADRAVTAASRLVDYEARIAEDAAFRIEQVHRRSDRVALQMDAICVALAIVAAWFVLRAVRHAQRIEEQHRAMLERRADELEQFAGRVAHDVLSPLGSVGLALSVAQSSGSPMVQTAAQRGTSSLHRVRGIVEALLEFARSGARPEPGAAADVRATVSELVDELRPQAEEAATDLRVEAPPDCVVACSPAVLMVLLSNLLRNAFKYLGESATRIVTLRVRPRRSTVQFEVEDSGPGIPAELGSRIFEPYVRDRRSAAKPGIGLGLATVKRLVIAHGGTLGARRGSLGGALFWFELPRTEVQAVASPPTQEESVLRS
ncbi:MAG TPA: ATP-binding protein [Myxococcales bacterium]|nr:ATP-binding protein [Myxococcales bacterium]